MLVDARDPSLNCTRSALRPSIADQVLSATTATPFEISKTCFTPGTRFAFDASKLATLPPNTGHRCNTAYNMSGRRSSSPNVALPSTLDGVSRRLGDVPIKRNCVGSFSATFTGGVIFDAASASEPKLARAPVAVLTTKLFSALSCDRPTPHFAAAAPISISRAVAPALRSGSHDVRMLMLPNTPIIGPNAGSTPGNSVRIFAQSHSSSSASSIESDVTVPCPISAL